MKTLLTLLLLCSSSLSFGAEITTVKNDLGLLKNAPDDLKVGDTVEIRDGSGATIGTARVTKSGKQAGTFVVQRKSGKLVQGAKAVRPASGGSDEEMEAAAAPSAKPEPSERPLKKANVVGLGVMKPGGTFFSGMALAAAYDFFYPITKELNLRAGFWGWFKSEESGSFKTTYTVLSLDLGVDYFFVNGDFKVGLGPRLGYAIPIVTITFAGSTIPFAGKSSLTPAASVSAYYSFSGYIVGTEFRAAFYPKSTTGIPTSYFWFLSFGKEM
jgi:hypothetical protein